MSVVRCLSRPGETVFPSTNIVPKGSNLEAIRTRNTLGQFLEATLMRPLHFDDTERETQINMALDTMTLTERVFIEVEMLSRNPIVHSFDYDPLRT
jgi:hypothetical protein